MLASVASGLVLRFNFRGVDRWWKRGLHTNPLSSGASRSESMGKRQKLLCPSKLVGASEKNTIHPQKENKRGWKYIVHGFQMGWVMICLSLVTK